jgi:(p)ppGpp synthase/HD superfamily hydrolase
MDDIYLVQRAAAFATGAHCAKGQVRKYTGEDYIHHPARVAWLVEKFGEGTPAMVAASWLHDTVEDTDVSLALIESHFGVTVMKLVEGVTDPETQPDGPNRRQRLIETKYRLAGVSGDCQTIKLADICDNCYGLARLDPSYAKTYLAAKKFLLPVLTKGHSALHQRATAIIENGLKQLENQ